MEFYFPLLLLGRDFHGEAVLSLDHLVGQQSQEVEVHGLVVVDLVEHLGDLVAGPSAQDGGSQLLLEHALLAQAEVRQLRVALLIQQDVVQLYVSVDDSVLVELFDGEEYFSDVDDCFFFRDFAFAGDQTAQVAPRTEVGHQVQLVKGLECVAEFDNVPVVDFPLHFFFCHDKVKESLESPFPHDLHGVAFAFPFDQKHGAKSARPQLIDELEVLHSHWRLLVLLLLLVKSNGEFLLAV